MRDDARDDQEHLDAAVAAAQGGDERAFAQLFDALQPVLVRYLRALVGSEADDVAAEAWLRIARDLARFRGGWRDFRAWAVSIARHRAIDHLRLQSRRPSMAMPTEEMIGIAAGDDTAVGALEGLSTREAVALIAGLPRDQAEAVLLRVVVGLDAETAGRILGKRAGAVRTATYRGLRQLARRLGPTRPRDGVTNVPTVTVREVR